MEIESMQHHRAYSILHVKSISDEQRTFTGVATTPETDRMGDIVESDGVQYKNPLPLLLYHDSEKPVGKVVFDKPTSKGITFTASIPAIAEPGTLKERVDEAWGSVKNGLIAAVSIGFSALEYAFMETGGIHFQKTEVLELSLVSIPANASAVIQTVKSLDIGRPAAPGLTPPVQPKTTPGASGTSRAHARTGSQMKTTAEKIVAFKATKDAKVARLNEIAAIEDGSTMDEAQQQEFDTLENEIKQLDADLARLDRLEQLNKSLAKPVAGADPDAASNSRGGSTTVVTLKAPEPPKGVRFARAAMCLAAAKGNPMAAMGFAEKHYKTDEVVVNFVKAAVTTGTTADGGSWRRFSGSAPGS